jgi:hypothetical protein
MTREAVDHIGGDRRGRNRVEADVLLGEFQGDTLGQPLDGLLGGDIDRGLGCVDMAKGARRVDDGPSAAFEHGRRSGASSRRGRPKR